MLPTYAVGNAEVAYERQNCVVLGYVTPSPNIPDENERDCTVRWFRGFREEQIGPRVYSSARGEIDVAYTRVQRWRLGPPPEISFVYKSGADFATVDQGYALFESRYVLLAAIIAWILVCSYISGGLAGLLFQGRWNRYAMLGLWNLTTIVGLSLRLAKVQELGRKRLYLLMFSLIYLGLNWVGGSLLSHYLGAYSPGW